ncbi:hypothetical protein SK803_30845 [Lentzea sp. BCCO 10_0856]|uniref:Uncharacterized protein n=1 Tax=Lentzea miocenica TaxID=3095431 RepID=A0ABU4T901_9PSEU|nr:hypothetical protein [Lentzea sp. BCCO 10_0856]MDX8034636.1 hypothetical protein [Lentzea sp. BCCO 10_0856]
MADVFPDEQTIADAAVLDQVTEHISEVLDAGNHNQRKALIEALVVEVKVLSLNRLVPVLRVPQWTLMAQAPTCRCLPPGFAQRARWWAARDSNPEPEE